MPDETMQPGKQDHAIILFDDECVLCSANARFVLKVDHAAHFRLASMQSETGADLFRRFGIDPADPDTIIVVEGDKARRDSDAVIAIYEGLGWPWKAAAALRIFPRALRDPVYRLIARNRYKIFGKRDTCWMPPEHLWDRML